MNTTLRFRQQQALLSIPRDAGDHEIDAALERANEAHVSHKDRLMETYLAKAEKVLGRNINPCGDEAEEAYYFMREGYSAEEFASQLIIRTELRA